MIPYKEIIKNKKLDEFFDDEYPDDDNDD